MCGLHHGDRSFAMLAFPSTPLRNHGCAVKSQNQAGNYFAIQNLAAEGLIVGRSICESRRRSLTAALHHRNIPLGREACHNPTFSPLFQDLGQLANQRASMGNLRGGKRNNECRGAYLGGPSCNLCRIPLCRHERLPFCCFLQRNLQH
ncbi:hypothetical protein GGI42DRAFT_165248 [Trichoderma sp. SZMC 28013]